MNKRVIIVHGWGGDSKKDWMPWIKIELQKKGYEVLIPDMPETDTPKIINWVTCFSKIIGKPLETDILIGHSMGCQTILHYLESLSENKKVDKVILVAGFVQLMGLTKQEWKIAKPWLDTPLNLEITKAHANAFFAIFSDNDPFVPVEENKKVFEEKLGAKTFVQHNKGHFSNMPEEYPDLLRLF